MTQQGKFSFLNAPNALVKCAADGNPPSQGQVAGIDRALPGWLGLVTSHRRLFDASQDGWLRPPPRACFLLGQESFVSEAFSPGRNIIPVRLTFDVDKLPFPDVRKELELGAAGNDDKDEPRIVYWPAPIPVYAIKTVEVPSSEQQSRLLAMAGQTSNVSLPDTEIAVSNFEVPPPAAGDPATPETQSLQLPGTLNAIQGGMAMAVWAVPHVDPWIEVLRQALGQDAAGVAEGAGKLGAHWLKLPWLVDDLSGPARDDADDREELWRAALRCMQWSTAEDESPGALAERIALAARLDGTNRTTETWLDRTRRIVDAEDTIACDGWQQNAAGLAIQLALLRPDPMRFKSWNKELPGLPPGVWWAAATLCGWRQGYRGLDRNFRGNARLQEFLATRALEASWPGGDSAALPPSQQSPLERMREDGCFTLTWRDHPVIRKPWQSRAKWYNADLTDISAGRAARELAGRLEWSCIERLLTLPEGRVPTKGDGSVVDKGNALDVKGEKILRLPADADFHERIDPYEFRRRLAIEGGDVTDPPEAPRCESAIAPPGLIYRPGFITEEEETKLLDCIDRAEWSTELRRRVQHYGWRYDYKQRQIDESMRVGQLPEWARELARKLVNEGLMRDLSDQLIVNEYCGKQGISRHIDAENSFAEQIATISLLETWDMVFRRCDSTEKIEKPLERRSVAVLTGDARYKWTHEIPKRANDLRVDRQGKRKRVERTRRISLTFRTTRLRQNA